MGSILFSLGVLIAISLLSPLIKLVIAALAGKQIGAAALAQQPDQIHLVRAGSGAWRTAGPSKLADPLAARGFEDAGIHTITEMPGVIVQLLADPGHGFYAAVYEHPQAGSWFDLVSRFQDGTSVTFSTSHPVALEPRPGHPTVNVPGLEALAVLEKALSQRPRRPLQAVTPGQAVAVFEQSYAESIAYRKQKGIATAEVVKTAARKAA